MSPVRRRVALLVMAVVVAISVWLSALVHREATDTAADRSEDAHHLLTGMLEQETGLRGYQLTGDQAFLEPMRTGARSLAEAQEELDEAADDDQRVADALTAAAEIAFVWRQHADREIALVRRHGGPRRPDLTTALNRKALTDRFRAEVAELEDAIDDAQGRAQRRAAAVSAGLSLLLFLTVGGIGLLVWRRADRAARDVAERDRRYRDSQAEFAQTMQLVASEDEANALLRRHLQRTIPGAEVTVLNRTHGGDRLEARTPVADPALSAALVDPQPRACLAVRLARPHEEGAADQPLLACDVCGATGAERRCSPLLVSGEVIGSVLATGDEPFGDAVRRRLDDSVTTAAPVLANLRAVAMAEARATTDALTGLPNRRAFDETLTRMLAQARRSESPLAVVSADLDGFKDINDRYGHEKGDEVLAAAAATLQAALRASDFVARAGGEEFTVLAPDTDVDGAAVLAEHLRVALEKLALPGVDRAITASFGVAAYPASALTADVLLRKADRALYAAKEAGRNRVEVAPEVAPAGTATPA